MMNEFMPSLILAKPPKNLPSAASKKERTQDINNLYPLLNSPFSSSSKLSTPLYCIPVTLPSGFDKVTWRIPLSRTTCKALDQRIGKERPFGWQAT